MIPAAIFVLLVFICGLPNHDGAAMNPLEPSMAQRGMMGRKP